VSDIPIVALVCSSGGLGALTRVLTRLPADLSAAVIVLQHMQPDRASQLATLLDHQTALPVAFVADGDRLTTGRVFVAPPGQHTILGPDATLVLIPSGALPPYRPSADLLLTTLAVAAGPRLMATMRPPAPAPCTASAVPSSPPAPPPLRRPPCPKPLSAATTPSTTSWPSTTSPPSSQRRWTVESPVSRKRQVSGHETLDAGVVMGSATSSTTPVAGRRAVAAPVAFGVTGMPMRTTIAG